MNMNKMTQKSQEAFYDAQNIAIKHGHQEVDSEHLALALISQENGLIPKLIGKMGLPVENIRNALEIDLRKRPRVSGAGQEAGKIFVSQRLSQLIVNAGEEAEKLRDEYISVEHIFLAMLSEGTSSPSTKVFATFGLTKDGFLKTLCEVRGNQRVTTD
ncbi:MAG: Clp protease N-terminal domain-containing protein, partial [Synergistaceae bacterium]|nr:Clp protease N-terminal domain-containing protein [Synergistaceae bacterium]